MSSFQRSVDSLQYYSGTQNIALVTENSSIQRFVMYAGFPLYKDNTLYMTVEVERLQVRHLTLLAGWSDYSHTRKHISDREYILYYL